jgi:5,10-methylenetetrahydromethanopterin reductase
MRYGINFIQDAPLPEVVGWWREAEDFGFEWIGIPDSPILVRELYVSCAAFALSTKRARCSPMVSNPVSRHPSVTAGALFSLEELAPGRVALGIGSGDSAIYGIGLKGSPVDELAEYIRAVKGLLRGEEVTYHGKAFRAEWRHWEPPRDIKVYVSCHGPRVMKMAAQVADGIISGHGVLPENVEYVEELVARAAGEVGRDPAEVDIWHHVAVSMAPTVEEAYVHASAGGAYFMARFTTEGKQIPDQYKAAIMRLAEEENLARHGRGNPNLLRLSKELGVMDYLVDRAGGLIGPEDIMAAGVKELARRGVRKLIFLPLGEDKLSVLRMLGSRVLSQALG